MILRRYYNSWRLQPSIIKSSDVSLESTLNHCPGSGPDHIHVKCPSRFSSALDDVLLDERGKSTDSQQAAVQQEAHDS
jgi:hypothetical protein